MSRATPTIEIVSNAFMSVNTPSNAGINWKNRKRKVSTSINELIHSAKLTTEPIEKARLLRLSKIIMLADKFKITT